MHIKLANRTLDLSRPLIMGVVNVTPDSFSDGGQFVLPQEAVAHAGRLVAAGADILDIGGESTRPGATQVSAAAETDRVIPVIEAIAREFDVPISLDTSKPEVMRLGVAAGAAMLNDVRALAGAGALEAAAALGVPVCLMHMQGEPENMQKKPIYQDVVSDILGYLENRLRVAREAGIGAHNLLIDPGFGFGKTLEHNIALLNNLDRFIALGYPLLVGISRKSMVGGLLEQIGLPDPGPSSPERMLGSVTLALAASAKGAHIVRVHDVKETAIALRMTQAVEDAAGDASR
jgi:dihydropteroate synthase